jgi:nucleotide-binding universal stress UspA family protein
MSSTGEPVEGSRQAGLVIVGVDGSSGSLHALSWAGREARLRGATLEIVVEWTYPIPVALSPVAPEFPEVSKIKKEAHDFIERSIEAVRDDVAGVNIERQVAKGTPSQVLLERAKDADLLVVGSRGLGGFGGLVLGSVSQQCVLHTTRPAVVAPPHNES